MEFIARIYDRLWSRELMDRKVFQGIRIKERER
jgi:hypothetical protein